MRMHRVDHAIAAYRLKMRRREKIAQIFWAGVFIDITVIGITLVHSWF